MKFVLLLLSPLFISFTSHALDRNQLPLVTVQSDSFPNETYTIGFEYDSNGAKVGIFYLDPYQEKLANRLRVFSLQQLQSQSNPPVLLSRVKRDIIKLYYQDSTISVLYRKDATKGEWSTKRLKVACIGSERNCIVSDADSGKVTNSLYIQTHYNGWHFAVGVESIEVR